MKMNLRCGGCILLLVAAWQASVAETRHVSLGSTNPVAPFLSWETASTSIQAAVDAAVDGDTVLVTDGVFFVSQEVLITNGIQLASVNGYGATALAGLFPAVTTRCLAIHHTNALVTGFTITNGVTTSGRGGGVFMGGGVLSNCLVRGNTNLFTCSNCVAEASGGGIYATGRVVITDCTIRDNDILAWGSWNTSSTNVIRIAGKGAGIYLSGGVVSNCSVLENVNHVVVAGQYASALGGGIYAAASAWVVNCAISNNLASGEGPTSVDRPGHGAAGGGGILLEGACLADLCEISSNTAYASSGVSSFFSGSSYAYGGGVASGRCTRTLVRANKVDGLAGSTSFGSRNPIDLGGGGASSCDLSDCILENNLASGYSYPTTSPNRGRGGGAVNGTLLNCTLRGNTAIEGGGGASGGTLGNCILAGNSAFSGGGSSGGTLNNCVLASNIATNGGGSSGSTLNNSIAYFNTAINWTNYDAGTLSYCCTTPAPGGTGNITNDPQFVDLATSNFHLGATSPCVDAGNNATATASDFDGTGRPLDGNNDGTSVADMGIYEVVHPLADSDQDGLVDTNELVLGTNPARADTDGDRVTDNNELILGTDPLLEASVLEVQQSALQDGAAIVVTWPSVTNRLYALYRSVESLTNFSPVATGLTAYPPANSYTDVVSTATTHFYCVTGGLP